MSQWFVLRPTFEFPIRATRDQAIAALQACFQQQNQIDQFLMHGEYGELHLEKSLHRFWSPHLSFYVTDRAGQCIIRGLFAPRAEVWTTVWIIYLAMAFAAFYSFAMAGSQWALDEPTWWHWLGLAATLAIVAVYMIAHIGQQWSADQMRLLRERLDELLKRAEIL
jgi:hypothetical protein